MNNRIALQKYLQTLTPNVYFQPPSNTTIKYPAIVYTRSKIIKTKADNTCYKKDYYYNLTVIDKNPDSIIADRLLKLDECEFDRQFVSDGISHIAINMYY